MLTSMQHDGIGAARTTVIFASILAIVALISHVSDAPTPAAAQGAGSADRLAVVSDHRGECERTSIFDVDVAAPQYRSTKDAWAHPGRLAGVRGLGLVVVMPMVSGPKGLYALERTAVARPAWRDIALAGTRWSLEEGGVAFTSDDRFLLSATQGMSATTSYEHKPPYGVVKHDRTRVSLTARTLGPELAYYETGMAVAEIVPDPNPNLVHLVMVPAVGLLTAECAVTLATLDVTTMTEVGRRIDMAPMKPSNVSKWSSYAPVATVRAAMAPDGRHVAVSLWADAALAVADIVRRSAWRLPVPDVDMAMGIAFNHGPANAGFLAVQGLTRLAVYRWTDGHRLDLVNRIDPLNVSAYCLWDLSHVAWTGDGQVLVATEGTYPAISAFSITDGGLAIRRLRMWNSCRAGGNIPQDILTDNRPAPVAFTPEPTGTMTPTPEPMHTLTPTPEPMHTSTPTLTRTPTYVDPTASAPPTHQPGATSTLVPRPLYLPLLLRERCPVEMQRIDVVLVIDASTTMRDDRTAAGRTKLAAALEAALLFVDALALPADHAAVVGFNSSAWLAQGLTGRRADILSALARVPDGVRQQTRIDLGIQEAHRELVGERRSLASRPVMIVLTDALANPEPASTAVQRAAEAKAEDITIFTVGLGDDGELDVPELTQIASRPEYFYRAPDGEALAGIYRAIAVTLPCPGVRLWGRQ